MGLVKLHDKEFYFNPNLVVVAVGIENFSMLKVSIDFFDSLSYCNSSRTCVENRIPPDELDDAIGILKNPSMFSSDFQKVSDAMRKIRHVAFDGNFKMGSEFDCMRDISEIISSANSIDDFKNLAIAVMVNNIHVVVPKSSLIFIL